MADADDKLSSTNAIFFGCVFHHSEVYCQGAGASSSNDGFYNILILYILKSKSESNLKSWSCKIIFKVQVVPFISSASFFLSETQFPVKCYQTQIFTAFSPGHLKRHSTNM